MAVRTRSLVLLFLALASGVAAAWLSLSYLRRETTAAAQPDGVRGQGESWRPRTSRSAASLTEQDVRVVDWPGNAVPAGLHCDTAGRHRAGPDGPGQAQRAVARVEAGPHGARVAA